MTKKITARQQAILDSIVAFTEEKGYGPTVREICEIAGLRSPSTAFAHLNALEKKGFIKRDEKKSRSIIVVGNNEPVKETAPISPSSLVEISSTISLPLVGNVAAGTPILAEENITEMIDLPVDIVSDAASFVLHVQGDSMIEAGILSGDYLVVREQPTANNGDIVVAYVDDGATVKRFYKEDDHIRLQPENSTMDPIIVQDCTLAGKAVAIFRRL